MGVVVNGSSSGGPRGLPPYFGCKRRNYKRMKSHQGKQSPTPPTPQVHGLDLSLSTNQKTKKHDIYCTNLH